MSVHTLHHRTSPSNPRELSLVQQARGVEVEVVSVLEHCSAAAGHTLDTPSHSTIFRPLTSKFLSRILFRFTKMGRYHWQYHIKSAGSWTSAEGRWSLYNLGHGTSQNMVSRASSRKYTHTEIQWVVSGHNNRNVTHTESLESRTKSDQLWAFNPNC